MTTALHPPGQARWHHELKQLFVLSAERYRAGERDAGRYFTEEQEAYLRSIGQTPQEIYDFAEDHARGGEPEWETVLLISAARRDYLSTVQGGMTSAHQISMDDLPPKDAQLEGIAWLPRIIKKAEAKLRGEMPPDLMYGCGGDRNFFRQHGLEPADFLRHVWSAQGDEQKVLAYVRGEVASCSGGR
jgi:hypothetical protein